MLFSATGVTNSTNVAVPYGPWPAWGQLVSAFADANPMPAERGVITYSAWMRLARCTQPTHALEFDPEAYKTGDSHIALTPGLDYAVRVGASGTFARLYPNAEGRLSYIEIQSYSAPTIDDALNTAKITINSIAMLLPIETKVPVYWDAILVRSDDKLSARLEYNSPRPTMPLPQLDNVWMQESLVRFACVYAEGLRSESPFYRFLSFFKVAQQVNAIVRAQLRKQCIKHGISPPPLNGVLPPDPIGLFSPASVGKKHTTVIMEFQGLYRNSIAHLDAGDKILPFDLAVESRVRLASMVLAYIVEDWLKQIAASIKELRQAGAPEADIKFG
jgi:hypothetical protein